MKGTNLRNNMLFSSYPKSNIGKRKQNQDNYLVIRSQKSIITALFLNEEKPSKKTLHINWPSNVVRLAIADGMGGHQNGREIAQVAVEILMKKKPVSSEDEMYEMIQDINKILYQQFHNDDEHSPGTTLIVMDLDLETGIAFLAHVGDSRFYEIDKNNNFLQITNDHTFCEFDYRAGELSEKEYKERLKHSTSEIIQALGNGSFGIIIQEDGYRPNRYSADVRLDRKEDLPDLPEHTDIKKIKLSFQKTYMIATDGLWHSFEEGKWAGPITENFLSENEINNQISRTIANEGKDNISLIVFGYKALVSKNNGQNNFSNEKNTLSNHNSNLPIPPKKKEVYNVTSMKDTHIKKQGEIIIQKKKTIIKVSMLAILFFITILILSGYIVFTKYKQKPDTMVKTQLNIIDNNKSVNKELQSNIKGLETKIDEFQQNIQNNKREIINQKHTIQELKNIIKKQPDLIHANKEYENMSIKQQKINVSNNKKNMSNEQQKDKTLKTGVDFINSEKTQNTNIRNVQNEKDITTTEENGNDEQQKNEIPKINANMLKLNKSQNSVVRKLNDGIKSKPISP